MRLWARLLLAALVTAGSFRAADAKAPDLTQAQQEHFLLTAQIVGQRSTGEGITGTKRLTLTDGVLTHDAHLQQIDVYEPLYRAKDYVEKDFRDSYKYNIAACRVAKMLGMDDTPVCVYRVVFEKPSSVCWWIDDVQFDEKTRRDKGTEPPDPNRWTAQLNEIRDFDQLIDNVDRTQENLLIDKGWKLWMIDHSRSFRLTNQLRKPQSLRRISQSLLAAMKNLSELRVAAATEPYLTAAEVHAMMVRRDLLVNFFKNQVAQKGEDAVYTDIPRKTPIVVIP
jgi:hypothetical protein